MSDAPLVPSGHADVDRQWGGLVPGAAYLLVGRADAGRSALALQAVAAATGAGRRCLLISPTAPDALVETARGVGLDLAHAHGAGLLRLLRIPNAEALAARGDDGLAASYREFVRIVQTDRPARVVVEDFTPLVQFTSFDRLRAAFSELVGDLRGLGVPFVVGLGSPVNDASRQLVDAVAGLVDGVVRLADDGSLSLEPTAGPQPASAAAPPAFSTSDGASVPTADPVVPGGAATSHEPPPTPIVPPPPIDPALLAPVLDTFDEDPVDEIMDDGFLADSGMIAAPAPLADAAVAPPPPPSSSPPPAPPPAAAPPSFEAPAAPAPAFSPLRKVEPPAPPESEPAAEPTPQSEPVSQPEPTPAQRFRQALDAAFGGRAAGTPFLVIALRMDPPPADPAAFGAVEAGLRSGLRDGDQILVDADRNRAVLLLPDAEAAAGQQLFERLQVHLQSVLGEHAEPVLAAVGAVTIPDGQPFTGADDLMAYAFEG